MENILTLLKPVKVQLYNTPKLAIPLKTWNKGLLTNSEENEEQFDPSKIRLENVKFPEEDVNPKEAYAPSLFSKFLITT